MCTSAGCALLTCVVRASTCGVLATDHLRGDRGRICGMRCAHLRGECKHLRGAYGRLPARWSWTYLRGVSSAFVAFWHLRGVCLRDHHHGDSACYMRAERACKPLTHVFIISLYVFRSTLYVSMHGLSIYIYLYSACCFVSAWPGACSSSRRPLVRWTRENPPRRRRCLGTFRMQRKRNRIRRERKSGRRA